MIVAAWLAAKGNQDRTPESFAWPAIIHTDDPIMEQVVVNLAENHMHLYAGASTFSLTWCCAMNHPECLVQKNNDWMERFLQLHGSRGAQDNVWSMKRRLIYAARLRQLLFLELIGNNGRDIQVEFKAFHQCYPGDVRAASAVAKAVQQLQYCYGLGFDQPKGKPVCLDYAFVDELSMDRDKDYRVPAAERYLLFRCFQKCFRGEFSLAAQWLFYCYLLLKGQFRGELIQINQQTGFSNFHDYDSRKYQLWKNAKEYWFEDYRQAINASFHTQSLISLEGRISPDKDPVKNLSNIFQIDLAKLFFDAEDKQAAQKIQQWKKSYYMENLAEAEQYHFVMHFAKRKDTFSSKPNGKCRHNAYRKIIRSQAIGIAKALSNSDFLCQRIYGIDACSNEIHCRPEVFANAFRFLREFPAYYYKKIQFSKQTSHLRVTYHVGEDFLDIADGLRAIDEAVYFLGFRNGDRLGHALALGVSPEIHYAQKNFCIVLPEQDLLDNLAWILYRCPELGVAVDSILQSELRSEAQALFDKLYQPYCEETASLEDYYHSMLLRGDSPEHYETGAFSIWTTIKDPYDFYSLSIHEALTHRLEDYRKQRVVTKLVQIYHYSHESKRDGRTIKPFPISQKYVLLMTQIQEAMQQYINSCRLSIECNPSSNVLIGTFGMYQEHPILRFNHTGLNMHGTNAEMHVSINSDDPGVFDTTLTFEYHILAAALTNMTDKQGARIHSNQEIKNYLCKLIQMGQEQIFS